MNVGQAGRVNRDGLVRIMERSAIDGAGHTDGAPGFGFQLPGSVLLGNM